MKLNFLINLALMLVFTSGEIFGQDKTPLPLSRAIELSLKNNDQLKISGFKILTASANLKEAKSHRLPEASVSGSYLRLNNANITMANPGQGGEGGPTVNQVVYGMLSASYPIYTGGKVKYGIESAHYLEEAARLDAAGNKDAVILNTMEAYANLYKASIAVNVIKENLIASRKRDTTFSRLEENGLMARNDMLKANLQTSNIELALMEAESNYRVANVNMDILLGLPETTNLEVDSTFVNYPKDINDVNELQLSAFNNRKDIQSLNYQQKSATAAIRIAKADAFPSVALTGGYVAADIPNFISITNAMNIGIGVKYNVASLWKENTGQLKAESRQLELSATQHQLTDQIKMQINRDKENFEVSRKKVDLFENNIIQASENFRIINNKYNNSLVTITDLLEADVSLLQAKLNKSLAKVDATLAYQKLMKTTGTLTY